MSVSIKYNSQSVKCLIEENTTSSSSSETLHHDELVVSNLLEVLEEEYNQLTKEQLDAIVMLLIEHSLN